MRNREHMTTSSTRYARIAAIAALVASIGDLLLLYVANSLRSELGLVSIGEGWLWLGGAFGVIAIPFYALGYRSASHLVAPTSVRAAQALFVTGSTGGFVGAVIHGITTVHISGELEAGVSGGDPMASLLSSGGRLVWLWGIATIAVIVASVLFAWFVARGNTAAPRGAAVANPVLVTIVLAALGSPFVFGRAFLTPAAPNIAHLVFFLVCAHVSSSQVTDSE